MQRSFNWYMFKAWSFYHVRKVTISDLEATATDFQRPGFNSLHRIWFFVFLSKFNSFQEVLLLKSGDVSKRTLNFLYFLNPVLHICYHVIYYQSVKKFPCQGGNKVKNKNAPSKIIYHIVLFVTMQCFSLPLLFSLKGLRL